MGSQAREVVAEDFYPRPPRGGRLPDGKGTTAGTVFLSTPSARRATLRVSAVFALVLVISIHALREEGDLAAPSAPVSAMAFLSTPSARRATPTGCFSWPHLAISIHALCEEGDSTKPELESSLFSFLSTPSARRATRRQDAMHLRLIISIHALREEGDETPHPAGRVEGHISIHALREEGDARKGIRFCGLILISIHALREEGDAALSFPKIGNSVFLSTPSARRATTRAGWMPRSGCYFYPRPPRGGRRCCASLPDTSPAFLSTPSARRATCALCASGGALSFLSTPSARRATAKTEKNISAFVSL